MTVKELLQKNRSYRGFYEEEKLSKQQLLDFTEHARYTASSINRQPLRYYLAADAETVARIQPLTGWARALPHLQLPFWGQCPPAFIVICQDTAVDGDLARYQKDVGIAAEAILLAATEAGYGGCMIGNFSPEKISETLSLDRRYVPLLILALGRPCETICIVETDEEHKTNYYRDEQNIHYVPKRPLAELIIE